jgi:hypothetical protein
MTISDYLVDTCTEKEPLQCDVPLLKAAQLPGTSLVSSMAVVHSPVQWILTFVSLRVKRSECKPFPMAAAA